MSSIQEKALVHLTGTANLGSIKEDSLLELANEYPYFAPIQLLLSAKLKETNAITFNTQAQKTNFYFSNPYWVHYLLSDFSSQNKVEAQIDAEISANPPISNLEIASATDLAIDTNESVAVIETPSFETANDIQIPTVESVVDLLKRINHPYEEAAATAESNTKIANLLSEQLADFKKPISEEAKLEITREPLHTTDYFASQGIKIDLSQIPQDKLTTQLRRFTDWLKYMKTDNPTDVDLETRQDLEEAVVLIAKTSNEQKEIVTETMAEIFQKQGQVDKAIQLYIKLSFINPEKSAYFA
ncbi:MAG: hypothetical protein WCL56_06335, partial [Sediminibacterium sp.]